MWSHHSYCLILMRWSCCEWVIMLGVQYKVGHLRSGTRREFTINGFLSSVDIMNYQFILVSLLECTYMYFISVYSLICSRCMYGAMTLKVIYKVFVVAWECQCKSTRPDYKGRNLNCLIHLFIWTYGLPATTKNNKGDVILLYTVVYI